MGKGRGPLPQIANRAVAIAYLPDLRGGRKLEGGVGWETVRAVRDSTDCRSCAVTVCHVAGIHGLPPVRVPQPNLGPPASSSAWEDRLGFADVASRRVSVRL